MVAARGRRKAEAGCYLGTSRGIESTVFSGGIIMLSNRPLTDLPELRAIRTRISHLHLQATDQEIAALMRKIARNGFQHGQQSMTSQEVRTCPSTSLPSRRRDFATWI